MGNKNPKFTFLCTFLNAFTPSATAESVDSFLLLLKNTFATAQLQKRCPIDSCMLHVYCSKLSDEKWHKIRSAAVWGGKSNYQLNDSRLRKLWTNSLLK